MSPWESRRDAMLDVFGKAQPFTMTPALQINRTDARLLVEALSGRWSYDNDRRDKRNLWYYVANAFSLLIGRISPNAPKLNQGPIKVEVEFNPGDAARNYQIDDIKIESEWEIK
jgi:hypothetical protein